jgi:hypothetical protein
VRVDLRGRNLGIIVETERLGVRVERKCLDIVEVVLFVARRE